MDEIWDVIIVGSGNAALCAGIAACEKGAKVLMIEKASEDMAGGNTKYTAGAMRFAYETSDDLLPLLATPEDPRILRADFGRYTQQSFSSDLLKFNDKEPLSTEQKTLVSKSYSTLLWLASHGVTFDPIWSRQSFEKAGKIVFWGGLTLAAENEGVGLFNMELRAFKSLGGEIRYRTEFKSLNTSNDIITGVTLTSGEELKSKAEEAERAYTQALNDARSEASRLLDASKAEMKKELQAAINKADAEISVKVGESEKSIAEIRKNAMASIEKVAKDTAKEIVVALGAKADAKTINAAVSSKMKG